MSTASPEVELPPATVLVIDDHPAILLGLKHAVELTGNFRVCGEARGYLAGIEAFRELHPRIVVCDIRLKDGTGFDITEKVQQERPEVPILIVTAHNDINIAAIALSAGAKGFVHKSDAIEHIPPALEALLAGKTFFPAKFLSHSLFRHFQDLDQSSLPKVLHTFTDREREVLHWMGMRQYTPDIAKLLGVSGKTVEGYIQQMKSKCSLSTNQLREFAVAVSVIVRKIRAQNAGP